MRWLAMIVALFVGGAAVARAETAADAEPLGMEELMRVGEATTIVVDAEVRAAIAELVGAVPEADRRQFGPGGWERLADVDVELTLKDLSSVLTMEESTAVLAQLDDHENPIVRFMANATLAGRGDSEAAQAVYEVLHSEAPTLEEKRMLATWAAGIGLHTATETAESIQAHMTAMMSGEPKIKVGEAAPDFEAVDAKGEKLELKELRSRAVLLHFWATSCGPCVASFPQLKEQLAAFPESDLVVIAVSLDEDRAKFDKAIDELGLPWHNVFDGGGWGGEMARAYGVNRMPYDVVIDAEGIVQANEVGDLPRVIAAGKEGQ